MAGEESFFGLVTSKDRKPLPLKDVTVEAEICGYVLGLKSTLRYENASTDPLEVVFRFPLEQSHAVVGLTALIDGRKIRAELKEKQEAKMQYDDAIASGQAAALGEEKSGDIFSVSLGNLPPQKEAEIVLQLVGELPIDAEGGVRFSLPATLKPRYVPAGSTDPLEKMGGAATNDDQVIQASAASVQRFKLSVFNQEDVDQVTSPTHSIAVNREAGVSDSGRITVTLSDESQSLASDLVILVKHKHPHSPKALVEQGKEDGKEFMKQSALMINFFPEFTNEESLKCEFIFLVDRSGSMSGSYIGSARETLLLFLKSLPEDCHFNIIGFGSSYEKLFKGGSVAYSQASLDQATAHAQQLQANLGGTELLPPLKEMLRVEPSAGLARQVFVLTDGAVSNTHACIDVVKQNVSHTRCFTFGIGSGASTALVEGLARAGNGSAEFIKEGERMQPKVIRSLKRAIQAAVTNVSVSFDLKVPRVSTTYQCPDKLPPVYIGEKLVVYGLANVKGGKSIEGTAILEGEICGKAIQHKVPFSSQITSSNDNSDIYPVHRLAAKALIADWQDAGKPKEAIISVSVESSVVSSHTAFIAVDEENSKPVEGALQTWDIRAENLEYLEECSSSLQSASLMFQASTESAKKGGGLFSGLPSFGFGRKMKKKQAATSGGKLARTGRRTNSYSDCYRCVEDSPSIEGMLDGSDGDDDGEEFECTAALRKRSAAASTPSFVTPPDILSSLIAAQQADGSWQLTTLPQILSKTVKEVEEACPMELKGSQVMSMVWATVVVLTVLEKKCKHQQDEWELIAMKADKWLKRQILPEGVEMSKLYAAARSLV